MNRKNLSMMKEPAPHPKVGFTTRRGRESARKLSLVVVIVALVISGLVEFRAAAASATAGAAPGFYVISCLMEPSGSPQEPCLTGNEMPVGTALVLKAHVTDSSGTLAKGGQLIFQDCLLQGIPAPSIQCDSGPGTWSNIQRVRINGPEDIRVGYGSPSAPQTIGFRFRYMAGQGSGIANGISNSMDVTWF